MKNRILILLMLVPLLSTLGCLRNKGGGESDTPLSIAAPIANLEYVFISAPGIDGNVRITGLDGSVIGGSAVTAINAVTNMRVTVTASGSGSFQLEITAAANHSITLEVTANGITNSTFFTVSSTDPVPLDVQQTDVAIFQASNLAFVTATGSSTVNLVQIDLSTRQVTNNYLLKDPDTGVSLTDLIAIEIFENARIALLLDRTQLKFYLVDLNSVTMRPTPIAITGNFAAIVAQNEVSLRFTIKDVTENETLIRSGLISALQVFNDKVTTLPDTNTPLILDAQISPTTSHLVIAGTFSALGALRNLTIQNSDLSILSDTSLVFTNATLAGMGLYDNRTKALVGNQNQQSGLGQHRIIYVCDLATMQMTTTIMVDGIPEEMAASSDEAKVYLTQSNINQLLQIGTGTLAIEQTMDTGPTPTKLAIDPEGHVATVLNTADTTVSILEDL